MAAQVGSAFVAVMPSFRGFRKEVDSEVGAAGTASAKTFSKRMGAGGTSAGASLGKGVKAGFSGAASNLGASELKKLQGDVSKAASAYSTAVSKNADAIGRVRVARAALNDVKAKGNATSAQLARAEENLASAQRKAADAAANLKARGEAVTASRNALKAAEESAAAATDRAAASAEKSGGYFSRLKAAFVEGAPSARDYGSAVESASSSMKGFALGGAMAGVVSSVTSRITSSIGGLASEAVTASDATDKFRNTLKFAGLDTSTIDAVAAKTRKYADDTVYDIGDIQNMTAQLASNGVPHFEELAEAAGNLNAIAGGNAETFKSVGMVMTQTAGAGKLTTENWNQLADAIPGASGKLQEALLKNGAYTGNFRDAMAKGEITADEFNQAVMQIGSEPVAVEAAKSTETFEGMLGNLQATIVGGLSDALTNMKPQLGELASQLSDLAAQVIPAVVTGAILIGQALGGVISFVTANGDWLAPLVAGVVAFAAAYKAVAFVQGVITAWKTATEGVTVAQWLLNAAMSANPIGIVIGLIAALVAGLAWFFTQTEVGRQAWSAFMGWLQSAWQGIVDFFSAAGQAIAAGFQAGIDWIVSAWNGTVAWFQGIPGLIAGFFSAVGDWIATPFRNAGSWARSTFQGVVDWFRGVPGAIGSFFAGIGSTISAPFRAAFNWIRSAWNSTVGGFGFTVPGWIPGVGGKSFKIPKLADGATIKPRTGGTLALLAEAGRAETVVDTGRMNALMDMVLRGESVVGGSKQENTFNIESNDPAAVAAEVAERLRR